LSVLALVQKVKELRDILPYGDSEAIYMALANDELDIDVGGGG